MDQETRKRRGLYAEPEKDRDCKACGAPLAFVPDAGTGKKHPISLASGEKRIVVREVVEGRPVARVVTTYLSHFADCPESARFRKGGGDAGTAGATDTE